MSKTAIDERCQFGKRKCKQSPGAGTDHIGWGPCSKHQQTFDVKESWDAAMALTREYDITPWDALLMSVRIAAARVRWVDDQLEQEIQRQDGDMNQPNIRKWLMESRNERRVLARTSDTAIRAGVAQRMLRQVELEGRLVAEALTTALDTLELTQEQRTQAFEAAHMKLLSAGETLEDDDQQK